jgi:excisionase family DNA binding protein
MDFLVRLRSRGWGTADQDTTMRDGPNVQADPNRVRVLRQECLRDGNELSPAMNPRARMTVEEIARRLDIGRLAVYTMLEQGIIPAVRLGRRWIVTRHAFDTWERTCGMRSGAGLSPPPEVKVLS